MFSAFGSSASNTSAAAPSGVNPSTPQTFSFGANPQPAAAATSTSQPFSSSSSQPSSSQTFSFGSSQPLNTSQPFGTANTTNSQSSSYGQPHAYSQPFGTMQTQSFGGARNQAMPSIAQPPPAMQGIPFPKETKFADLPDNMQETLRSVEKTIMSMSDQSSTLAQRTYHQTDSISIRVNSLLDRIATCEASNEASNLQLQTAKRAMNGYWKFGEAVARSIVQCRQSKSSDDSTTNQLNPTNRLNINTEQMLALFSQIVARMELQTADLAASTNTIMEHVQLAEGVFSVSSGTSQRPVDTLIGSAQQQMDLFVSLAAHVANLQQEVEAERKAFRDFLIRYRGDHRDPFASASSTSSHSSFAKAKLADVKPSIADLATANAASSSTRNPPLTFPSLSSSATTATASAPPQTPNPFLLQTPRAR